MNFDGGFDGNGNAPWRSQRTTGTSSYCLGRNQTGSVLVRVRRLSTAERFRAGFWSDPGTMVVARAVGIPCSTGLPAPPQQPAARGIGSRNGDRKCLLAVVTVPGPSAAVGVTRTARRWDIDQRIPPACSVSRGDRHGRRQHPHRWRSTTRWRAVAGAAAADARRGGPVIGPAADP